VQAFTTGAREPRKEGPPPSTDRMTMKKLLATAALLGTTVGLTTVATAATPTPVRGKLVSFTYSASTKTGKVTVSSSKGKYVYTVNAKTDCGVSYGQSGDQIACKTLGAAKYARKPVYVTYHRDAKGHRVADVVAPDLS
jgi:hypothetical protein